MSSIYDVSSIYDTYSQSMQSTSGASAQSALSAVNENTTDEELMDACKGFESYFVQKIIEKARKMVESDEEDKDEYLEMFGDTLNQAYADKIVEGGGIGIAQQLYDSMKRD
ncbi:MAG: rod-binding protein [Lachnospiraceae bacterium]|nr:rod-binding protein [Lachnospiraceae bacterium]